MKDNGKPKLKVIPLRKMAPFDSPSEMDFLIRIEAPERPSEMARPTLNLGLVLDRSGSMSGGKIEKAKDTACFCVDQLLPFDRISVTIFDDQIDVIVPTTEAKDRQMIKQAIRRISAGGTTALHAGWVEGARQVAECADQGRINRVLLVTDGLANVGVTDPETIITQARGLLERGISTSTFGVGIGFNEDLLVPMARAGGGNHEFIEGAEDFERIFARPGFRVSRHI